MSSDNYYLIRRFGATFGVSGESASAAEDPTSVWHPTPAGSAGIRYFDDLEAARDYAHGEYAEYGVVEHLEVDSSGDTYAARLAKRGAELADRFADELRTNNADGSVTLHLGEVTVTVAASEDAGDPWDAVCAYAEWLQATSPETLAGT